MRHKGAGSEGGLPTVTIVIISIIIMLIVAALIFLALPMLEDKYGEPGPCDDTCYKYKAGTITDRYADCKHPNRYIIHYHDGDLWQYHDGFEGTTTNKHGSLHQLRQGVQNWYEGGIISEGSWHWFDCTAEAIS